MEAMDLGRPREHDREKLKAAFQLYISQTPIPIVAEFAANNGLSKQYIHQTEDFIDLVKICLAKKEAALERKSLAGDVNVTMAIFSLKQLGWSDRQDITHKGDAAYPLAISSVDGRL
jgi:hypothetical protein